ncbi:Glyoxalase/Bleomycin resistance protein/Dihydroxybiphenyl dioxygenase [Talaromyces proteolyticus]|uniref:Glyoxalase/Bleomycin resistance protein/Dihydroxybiphenyl dioxygenase n=1 Tax=Talaromyces proteolyticus TaxID=1131652 RepID=A0AAD4KM84_9EURO|nr:Glyoxalase/Bleomycin resistance protein/Dihydroxybiphenyl dioxygenase [Talaromyces proteolyticus]KAH8691677.1 Glyoxalase/Bleomycin resistance protein/Dihydroxybiphenyl dioxygenase [Talaromyces proteolyticus]
MSTQIEAYATSSANAISPSSLCHVVLRTSTENYSKMVGFYLTFLGAHATHTHPRVTFLTYDYEHHRIAIVNYPDLKPLSDKTVGLAHIAFGFKTLGELATSYEQKKAKGILPFWSVNHGMSTSMYYKDPDGNELEMQVDNFETAAEAIDFMNGIKFEENPIGVDYNPEEFIKRVRSSEDDKIIKLRPDLVV